MNVQGLQQELVIQTRQNQNRALNGDIVAVEILPKSAWISTFKASVDDVALLNEVGVSNAEVIGEENEKEVQPSRE